jgi:hypothetical protein
VKRPSGVRIVFPRRDKGLHPAHVDAKPARDLIVGDTEPSEAFYLLCQADFAAFLHVPPLLPNDQRCFEDTTRPVYTDGGNSRLMPG